MEKISIFAPATIANLGSGFDVLGLALDAPGDIVVAERKESAGFEFVYTADFPGIPADQRNVACHVGSRVFAKIAPDAGVRLTLKKGIAQGSGLGGSAASSVAAACAVNTLFGEPLSREALLPFVLEGERLAAGTAHADNAAPCLLGGACLVQGEETVVLPVKNHLLWIIVHPDYVLETAQMRKLLPREIPLASHTVHAGRLARLVAGLLCGESLWIAEGLRDELIEPLRGQLIPGFFEVKRAAFAAGALGCSISGSGPAIFAVCEGRQRAAHIMKSMQAAFLAAAGLQSTGYISKINFSGAREIEVGEIE